MYGLPNDNLDTKVTLIGLTSYGICGSKELPGVYARVDRVIEWIEQMEEQN